MILIRLYTRASGIDYRIRKPQTPEYSSLLSVSKVTNGTGLSWYNVKSNTETHHDVSETIVMTIERSSPRGKAHRSGH